MNNTEPRETDTGVGGVLQGFAEGEFKWPRSDLYCRSGQF